MYSRGQGVPQDYSEAARWYRLAAEQGNSSAQNSLAVMYYNGKGIPQNYILAHMWSNIGAANGNEEAIKLRDAAAVTMTPNDISKAQELARICMSSGYEDCGE